jgi:hypothetical protein
METLGTIGKIEKSQKNLKLFSNFSKSFHGKIIAPSYSPHVDMQKFS